MTDELKGMFIFAASLIPFCLVVILFMVAGEFFLTEGVGGIFVKEFDLRRISRFSGMISIGEAVGISFAFAIYMLIIIKSGIFKKQKKTEA